MTTKLFHVTPILNLDSIDALGLSPDFSQGRRRVIWVCERGRLTWSLAHISLKRSCPVRDLMVCTLRADDRALKRTRWQGVYVSSYVLLVDSYQSSETWLLRIERSGEMMS